MFEIFLDMDGVLADFSSAMDEAIAEERSKLEQDLGNLDLEHLLKLDWISLRDLFRGEQSDPKMAQAKKIYNKFRAKQYKIMEKEGWFYNLEPLPWADELVDSVSSILRQRSDRSLPHILTAPVRSSYCEPEKERWMHTHFPNKFDEFHCTAEKFRHAHPRAILIDDNRKFIDPFLENDGLAVHFTGNLKQSLNELENLIDQIE